MKKEKEKQKDIRKHNLEAKRENMVQLIVSISEQK